MRRLVVACAAFTLLAGSATAQTAAPGSGASAVRPVQPAQERTVTQMLASDALKASVYDPNENKIGTVDDLLLSRNGAPEQAIVGVGGFLGIGEKHVVIPFSELKIKSRGGKNWFELARTKSQLENAAAFDVKSHKTM